MTYEAKTRVEGKKMNEDDYRASTGEVQISVTVLL